MMVNIEYDCVKWSVDKNRSYLYIWYPESPSISNLPENYSVSLDNFTLIHKATGTPVIEYEENEFRILESITDWEMYICLNQKKGIVSLKDDICIKIGAVISGGKGRQLTTIRGRATIIYHDSIWSQSSIEVQGLTLKGHEDEAHAHCSFVYCDNFTGTDIQMSGINRIYGKGSVRLKNAFIRDEADESLYIYDDLNKELMPGMYLYAGVGLTIESSDIQIHNYIYGNYVSFIDSDITVNNLVSVNPAVSAVNRMLLKNTRLNIRREHAANVPVPSAVLHVSGGNLVLEDQSELNVENNQFAVRKFACISLGDGNIVISDSNITTTRYPEAIKLFCYGDGVLGPEGTEVTKDFEFAPQQYYRDNYRFKTALNGYTMWVYVQKMTVTKVECIEAEVDLESFNALSFKNYVNTSFAQLREEADKLQYRAFLVAATDFSDTDTFCIEGKRKIDD